MENVVPLRQISFVAPLLPCEKFFESPLMPNELDPLSQLIGGLAVQVSEVKVGLTDLRSEVITNRSQSQTWREDLAHKLDLVQAEYRNVKHDFRNFEMGKEHIDGQLRQVNMRLGEMERVMLVWKTKAAMVMAFAAVCGTVISLVLEPVLRVAVEHILK